MPNPSSGRAWHLAAARADEGIPRLTPGRLLTIEELSDYLQVPVKTLYDWRHRRLGPQGLRVGRYVRYRQSDVDAWLETCVDPGPNSLGVVVRRTAR
jgi:excisionase family DNA binding protein